MSSVSGSELAPLFGDTLTKDENGCLRLRCASSRGWTGRRPSTHSSPPFPGTTVSFGEDLFEVMEVQVLPGGAVAYFLSPWDERFLVRRVFAYEESFLEAPPAPAASAVPDRRRQASSAPQGGQGPELTLPPFIAKLPMNVKLLGSGALIAIGLGWFFPIRIFREGISFFVHELGHTVISWLFGRFALPAVILTITFEQTVLSVLCVWLGLGAFTWYYRSYESFRNVMIGVLVVYPFIAFTTLHVRFIDLGGHAAEIVMAAVFLVRVFHDERKTWERMTFSLLGWFLWERNVSMFARLIFDDEYKGFYYTFSTTGGDNDLVKVAKAYGVSLESVAFFCLFFSLALPAWALFHRWQKTSTAG
jgi:hypothetical protein